MNETTQTTAVPADVEALFNALALEAATEAFKRGNLTLAAKIVDSISR